MISLRNLQVIREFMEDTSTESSPKAVSSSRSSTDTIRHSSRVVRFGAGVGGGGDPGGGSSSDEESDPSFRADRDSASNFHACLAHSPVVAGSASVDASDSSRDEREGNDGAGGGSSGSDAPSEVNHSG